MNTTVQKFAEIVTSRATSLLQPLIDESSDALSENYCGKDILIAGGAGFIASESLKVILNYAPRSVSILDISENGLAESVRDLRTSNKIPRHTKLTPWLVDIASPLLNRTLDEIGNIDSCLNFSASKHVRSERNVTSSLRMLQTNCVGSFNLANFVKERFPNARHFVVSTDKAASPVNLMGASKFIVEKIVASSVAAATTTRFANVAFSSGSLLESWLLRMQKNQVLSVPMLTKRFFVTPLESGQLCTLASIAEPGHCVVPNFKYEDLVDLTVALEAVLDFCNLEMVQIETLDEGIEILSQAHNSNSYPALFTARDTFGEKEHEVFCAPDEHAKLWRGPLNSFPIRTDFAEVREFVSWLEICLSDHQIAMSLRDIYREVTKICPGFKPEISEFGLDDRI